MTMADILPFFAVPFGFAKLDNCAALNQELRTLFLARSAAGGEHANPRPLTQRNPQVFESNFGLFRSQERCVAAAQGILLAAPDQVRLRR